jgi:hypothetical protein
VAREKYKAAARLQHAVHVCQSLLAVLFWVSVAVEVVKEAFVEDHVEPPSSIGHAADVFDVPGHVRGTFTHLTHN